MRQSEWLDIDPTLRKIVIEFLDQHMVRVFTKEEFEIIQVWVDRLKREDDEVIKIT